MALILDTNNSNMKEKWLSSLKLFVVLIASSEEFFRSSAESLSSATVSPDAILIFADNCRISLPLYFAPVAGNRSYLFTDSLQIIFF